MNLFKRIFKMAQSEAHSIADKLEDPIKLTEQGIRDLKNDLSQAMQGLAQVKASAIRLKKDADDQNSLAADYERKAMLLLQRAQKGEIEMAEAERLATEALSRKEEASQRSKTLMSEHQGQQEMADQLQAKVQKLKQTITKYENELITLKARARTAESMKKINKQLSTVDSSSTIAMLEKMKDKVKEEESLAEAYGQIDDATAGVDEQINKALEGSSASAASDSLLALKKKMGMLPS
ncbi:phage shock protein A, PspA [Chloroherpeton thalassium ATCC 35110]|uniref:Phage shock protein A, PspA n=1 Tax=Chloroherpeton thalassium (strain ATCC 35110 / GB-78) TaxID=517418 RepID=B3QY71_CHLT3|nr:PspA/IM30 family protein [Chloroherpeton thalassium]ACF15037.1 phage shock protein A, PspA [Chloroherpeton thalassium ATCC 35110]